MLRYLAILALVLPIRAAIAGPAVEGLWLTQDHDGVIAVAPCETGDGKLCARIEGVILDHANDPTPVDYRGVSQCRLPLITDATQVEPNLWKGHITNPRNGDVWRVELYLERDGNLALRGYLGVPLLGQTQTWTRYDGKVPDDCRLTKPSDGDVVTR
nr:DUF2147 domain-containing protein [uncultured Rhodopila sp.]